MNKPRLSALALSLVFLVACQALPAGARATELDRMHRVLVLHSYHQSEWTESVLDGVDSVLGDRTDIDWCIEYMDTKRVHSEEYLWHLRVLYEEKYGLTRFSVILAVDDNAYQFALRHRFNLFYGAPLIFCGLNQVRPEDLADRPEVRGVGEPGDFDATLSVAARIRPDARRALVIADRTKTGGEKLENFAGAVARHFPGLEYQVIGDVTLDTLDQFVQELPGDSFVFFISFWEDALGRFVSPEALGMVFRRSPVPVFGRSEWMIGKGLLGGQCVSGYNHGRAAAELGQAVLNGQAPGTLPPLLQSPDVFMFDHAMLEKHGVDRSLLPPGSLVKNRPYSFYREHRGLVWTVSALLVGLGLLVAGLTAFVIWRQRVQVRLSKSEETSRVLLDAVPETAMLVDGRGVVLAVNDVACRRLGKSRKDIVGLPAALLEPGIHNPDVARKAFDVAATGETARLEFRHEDTTWDLVIAPVTDPDGTVNRMAYFARDVSDLKKAAEQMRTRLERARRQEAAIVRLATDDALYGADRERAFAALTEAAAAALGVERASVWLLEDKDTVTACKDTYHASTDHHSRGTKHPVSRFPSFHKHLSSSRAMDIPDVRTDERVAELLPSMFKPHGVRSALMAPIRVSGSLLGHVLLEHVAGTRSWEPDEVAFAGVLADQVAQFLSFEQRMRVEEALLRSEHNYREVFEASTDAIWIHDPENGRIVDANQAAIDMTGYRKSEMLGRTVGELNRMGEPFSGKDSEAHLAVAAQDERHTFEWQMKRKDDSRFWAEVKLKKIFLGGMERILAVARDISERKAAEAERARLLAILENTSDMVSMATPDRQIMYLNPAGFRMLDLPPDSDLLNLRIRELHPDWAGKLISDVGIPAAVEHGVWEGETALVDANGTEIPLSQVIMGHKSPDGELEFLSTVGRDISRRIKAENDLKRSEERFRALARLLPETVFEVDLETRLTFVNESAFKAFGYDTRDFENGLYALDMIAPHERERAVNRISLLLAGGPPLVSRYTAIRKDGTTFPCLVHTNIMWQEGKPAGLRGLIIDITRIEEAEEALIESEERFRAIFESARELIFLKDRHLRYTVVNPSMEILLDMSAGEIEGLTDKELFGPETAELTRDVDRRILRGEVVERELVVKVGNERFIYQVTRVPIRDKSGAINGICGIARDVSRTKQLESQLRQAQKMEAIGTLAGGIAHDFNNILSPVMVYTQLASRSLGKPETAAGYLDEVLRASRRAKDLIAQMLAFSRKSEIETKPVYGQHIISEALKLVRSFIPTTVELVTHVDKGTGPILADPTQIHQVLLNLCTNAYHAMADTGGTLTVEYRETRAGEEDPVMGESLEPGEYVRLAVSDTGQGMAAEVVERIFDPYFTTKIDGEGTGLGLSIVHGIVKSLNGEVAVTSEPGAGTTFALYIPRYDSEPDQPAETAPEPGLPRGTERIMFVDDEHTNAYMGKPLLEALGYSVACHTSSVQALKTFREAPMDFDLVITDLTMPGMRGDALAAEMTRIRPDMPVVICTGFIENIADREPAELNCRAFLHKPLDMGTTARVVRETLDRAKQDHDAANGA
ncbi:MAG: PAS domain S-box protein [Desulfatibacillaceae bacterium]